MKTLNITKGWINETTHVRDKFKMYSKTLPAGFTAWGLVSINNREGILVQNQKTSIWCLLSCNSISSLPQRDVINQLNAIFGEAPMPCESGDPVLT